MDEYVTIVVVQRAFSGYGMIVSTTDPSDLYDMLERDVVAGRCIAYTMLSAKPAKVLSYL